jgi:hypothetical protein
VFRGSPRLALHQFAGAFEYFVEIAFDRNRVRSRARLARNQYARGQVRESRQVKELINTNECVRVGRN